MNWYKLYPVFHLPMKCGAFVVVVVVVDVTDVENVCFQMMTDGMRCLNVESVLGKSRGIPLII